MALDPEDEILKDFLVEAGELLDALSGQLVDLEASPDDTELLNAIFRGFHTVKGGAGFLALTNLVDVCHVAENVFDLLRRGELHVDAPMMDVILRTLDCVNEMFEELKNCEEPSPGSDELLKDLHNIVNNIPQDELEESSLMEDEVPVAKDTPSLVEDITPVTNDETAASADLAPKTEDALDEEFENLLDSMQSTESKPVDKKPQVSEEKSKLSPGMNEDISDDEFESLLDALSTGAPLSTSNTEVKSQEQEILEPKKSQLSTTKQSVINDEISEQEFETFLDSLSKDNHQIKQDSASVAEEESASKAKAIKQPEEKATENKKEHHKMPSNAKDKSNESENDDKKKNKEIQAAAAETTVRVDTSRLDQIMNMVGELVLVRNRLVKLRGDSQDESLSKAVTNLDVVTSDLQMAVMKTRMQPIKKVFGRFPRVVRDLARSLKKEVVLEMEGEETDLDKNLVEALSDPLVHLVRNAVDHGIEDPDERETRGKSRLGKIVLSAEQAGDHILLYISDDGKGMDAEKLRQIAVERGMMDSDAAARLEPKECYNLIFMPGFSTKSEISDISGRGVGMDVVKTKITQLNGSLEVDSKLGEGSRICIKVPLTLAIMPTLMITVSNQTFALPLTSVNEIFHLDLKKTNVIDSQLVVNIRHKSIPLFYLDSWLGTNSNLRPRREGMGHVVIVTVGTQRVGFVVDALLGQEEVVIKALGDMLHGTPGMAGATITGDGGIAMILDVPGLLNRYARRSAHII